LVSVNSPKEEPVIGRLLTRRVGPLGLALTAYDVWRRLPAKQRRQLLEVARTQGPKVAAKAVQAAGRRSRPPR
jgi:hypothetical protein